MAWRRRLKDRVADWLLEIVVVVLAFLVAYLIFTLGVLGGVLAFFAMLLGAGIFIMMVGE